MTDTRAALTSLPKAELHVHLEGTLTASTRSRLAARHGARDPLAGVDLVAECRCFAGFARVYAEGSTVLRTAADFADAVDAYLAEAHGYGVRHVEFAVDVQTHHRRGVPLGSVVDGVCEGLDRWRGRGVSGGMIATLDRQDGGSAEDVLRALRPRRDDVLGIGVAGDERAGAPPVFAKAFAAARDWGWGRTAHAVAPDCIEAALETLGVDRVDHGFRVAERTDLVERMIGQDIALAACPVTNVLVGPVPSLSAHPLPRLMRLGVRASLSTDDPAYFGCGLEDVYTAGLSEMGLRLEELVECAVTSVDSSFATVRRKSELRASIDSWRAAHMPTP